MTTLRWNLKASALFLAIVAIATTAIAQPSVWIGESRTPELLGDAPIVLIKFPDRLIGFTWNNYALFFIHGRGSERVQCQMEQVGGGPIYQYQDGGLNCLIVWRGAAKFRGWIDFRGHERAFCGARNLAGFEGVCLWR